MARRCPPIRRRGSRRRFAPSPSGCAGSSFVNPAVEVEAVGFAPWDAHWLGVMVTPWFMNLMLLPRDAARGRRCARSEAQLRVSRRDLRVHRRARRGDRRLPGLLAVLARCSNSPITRRRDSSPGWPARRCSIPRMPRCRRCRWPTFPAATELGPAACAARGATRSAAVEARLPARTLPRRRT